MIRRLIGGFGRAALVAMIVVLPALLLPNVSVSAQEVTLVAAGIAAAFTWFEYASTHPGLIDFRFAPPYNRVRFFSFALQILCLSMLCRAAVGLDGISARVEQLADHAVMLSSFPFSPMGSVLEVASALPDPNRALLVLRASATSMVLSFGLMLGFGLVLWLLNWPVARRDFNLWVNLPTFAPAHAAEAERRLFRDGWFNLAAGVAVLYLAPKLAVWLGGPDLRRILYDNQGLVWTITGWGFVSGSLAIRGIAVLKVAWLVRRANRR